MWSYHCQFAITWAPEGTRKIGRPKVNWRRTAETERNSMGWSSWNQARQVAKNWAEWRRCTEALCTNGHEEERCEGEGYVVIGFHKICTTFAYIFHKFKL